MEFAQKQRMVANVADISSDLVPAISVVKTRLVAIGPKIAPRIAVQSKPNMIKDALESEIVAALAEISRVDILIVGRSEAIT